MPFDKSTDSIAITVPYLRIKSGMYPDSPFQKYCEPYIVSVAIDQRVGKANPALDFNYMPFPKVANGGTVQMLGDGHLIYGPKNPGEFVAISLLVMESDQDIREMGKFLTKTVNSEAVKLGMAAIVSANPGSSAILGIIKEMMQFIAGALVENGDDEIYRTDGVFLRDTENPYHVNRRYTQENDWVEVGLQCIPLSATNGQGAETKPVSLLPDK